MTFDDLCIGDLFNTKSARYVKINNREAIVVMPGMFKVGTIIDFSNTKQDIIVLYSSNQIPYTYE